jgi:hypothetical protein
LGIGAAKERDPSAKAGITHYLTDPASSDYKTRALVFGEESARISGHVVVNPDGTKTFERVENQANGHGF